MQEAACHHDSRRAPHLAHILEVEEKFGESMAILNTFYRPELESFVHSPGSPLNATDVEFIFRGLDDIILVNSEFSQTVRDSVTKSDALTLGDTFKYFAHSFKMFDPYICKFDQAMDLVRRAQRRSERFRERLDELQMDPRAQGQDIASLMIRPVQLVPRFSLLLRDLIKYTDPAFPGYRSLEAALGVVDSVADTVNKHIADYQNRQKLVRLRESIRGCPEEMLQPHRTVVRTGVLEKVCRNSVELRFIALLSDSLLYAGVTRPPHEGEESAAAASDELNQPYVFHRQIPLENSRTLPVRDFQANTLRLIRRFGTGVAPPQGPTSPETSAAGSSPDAQSPSPRSVGDTGHGRIRSDGVQRTIDAVYQIADPSRCFLLVTPDKSFILRAASPAEATAWQCAISQVCAAVDILAHENPSALEDVRQGKAKRRRLLPFLGLRQNAPSQPKPEVPADPPNRYRAPVWVPDSLAPNCMSCGAEFTQIRRRHHCRFCGAAICATCSPHTFPLVPGEKPKRVCEMCYHQLKGSSTLPPQLTEETLTDLADTVCGPALAYPAGWFAQECLVRPGSVNHKAAREFLRAAQFEVSQHIDKSRETIEEMNAAFDVRRRALAARHPPEPPPPLSHPFSLGGILHYTIAALQGRPPRAAVLAQYFIPDEDPPHMPLEGDLESALRKLPQMRAAEESYRRAMGVESPWDVRCEYEHYRQELESLRSDTSEESAHQEQIPEQPHDSLQPEQ